ncbi:hypothetical protein [Actinoalloteichus hymeniacidonis]|uniref:Uncharacterized protein n=1 Tax=Actinoalloteichus hymeniacidonis TaxID=340345 RepID=A0AAC9HSV7_9PSEU|nr:hypothetical protein [Actinoalloteichus hymeniacidonis]AOS64969.1 hypothetical protein TL08_20890 [Actinoalloteichus hymeniacidonis]MBB5906956.1 hypothetical protein [Actinoalloteichus hymeniacidonis]
MPIDGFVGTALGGLALMVFGAVLIWISFGSPAPERPSCAASDSRSAAPKPRSAPRNTERRTTSTPRVPRPASRPAESRRAAARVAAQRLDDALLTIASLDTAPLEASDELDPSDPSPHDRHAFDAARFDPSAGDALLLRESHGVEPADDDFYCVAAIVARCTEKPPPRSNLGQRTDPAQPPSTRPPRPTGYVTAFTGSLSLPIRSAA